jgi:hypothetical protein
MVKTNDIVEIIGSCITYGWNSGIITAESNNALR